MTSRDFAQLNQNGKRNEVEPGQAPRKRRRVRHKVVIHSSPFLRCLQTSVAIAAGMAQYTPTIETGSGPRSSAKRTHSAQSRVQGSGLPSLEPNIEAEHGFAHALALRALHDRKRYRRSKLRVDAFLGEWLNPQYFEGVTAPPPSTMMVTTAKAELMENEAVQIFESTAPSTAATSTLWAGSQVKTSDSQQSPLEDMSAVQDKLLQVSGLSGRRSRTNSTSSVGDDSGRKSPFRPGAAMHPLTSTLPKPELSIYHPPTPHYAISSSSKIPRGYVAHARNACTEVDYQWDSNKPPQAWGDGGDYGEEWSSMHKRFRRGLNGLIQYYSHRNVDDRFEDSLEFEQAGSNVEEEIEDLVVVLVTHGAGCNALIGALTGQPVLLDVGTASLTMAVRRDDALQARSGQALSISSSESTPPQHSPGPEYMMNGQGRRGSLDMGLSSIYEMKIVASSDHLRPGADASRAQSPLGRNGSRDRSTFTRDPTRSTSLNTTTSSALGSIRRPTVASRVVSSASPAARSTSLPRDEGPTRPVPTGLWAPAIGSPLLRAQASPAVNGERPGLFSTLSESGLKPTKLGEVAANKSGSSTPRSGLRNESGVEDDGPTPVSSMDGEGKVSIVGSTSENAKIAEISRDGTAVASADQLRNGHENNITTMSTAEESNGMRSTEDQFSSPPSLEANQKGLWSSAVISGRPGRAKVRETKRRWTVNQD